MSGKRFNIAIGTTIFGRLTVIQDYGRVNGRRIVKCKCECGTEKDINWDALVSGKTKSCGCFQIEVCIKTHRKHGLFRHPIYTVWQDMLARCRNAKSSSYKNYGARGVMVCDEWRENFKCFYDWMVSNGWTQGLQIDKDIIPDQLGIMANLYCPEFCCLVTATENMQCTRTTKLLEYNGESLSLAEWGRRFKKKATSIMDRINKGWDVESAITIPRQRNNQHTKNRLRDYN